LTPFVFSYNGILSSQYGIYATEHDFFNPPKRQSRRKIDFRHGEYDFDVGMYDSRILNLNCFWKNPKTRHDIREVTLWLSGKGKLALDIEPDKHYIATLYDSSDLTPHNVRWNGNAPSGEFRLSFYCEPFAYSDQTIIPVGSDVMEISYNGTASTPTLIILRNLTESPIRNITVTSLGIA